MDIRQLQEFVDLAKTCNFQETANNLNTSQSCISKHIHKLEEELDVQLFDRANRSVKLTEFGVSFIVYARQAVNLMAEASHKLSTLKKKENNSLNVGFHPILGQYGLVELIASFSNEHPEITMQFIESNNPEEMLRTLQCDVVFAPEDELSNPNIQRIPYMRDSLAVICPVNHPLAQEKSVSFKQLQNENFIAHCRSYGGLQSESVNFLRICEEEGFTPKVVASVSRTATICRFVSQSKGIAVLFRKHIPVDIEGIAVVDIAPEMPVNICIFHLKNRSLPASVNTFLKYMKSQAHF